MSTTNLSVITLSVKICSYNTPDGSTTLRVLHTLIIGWCAKLYNTCAGVSQRGEL